MDTPTHLGWLLDGSDTVRCDWVSKNRETAPAEVAELCSLLPHDPTSFTKFIECIFHPPLQFSPALYDLLAIRCLEACGTDEALIPCLGKFGVLDRWNFAPPRIPKHLQQWKPKPKVDAEPQTIFAWFQELQKRPSIKQLHQLTAVAHQLTEDQINHCVESSFGFYLDAPQNAVRHFFPHLNLPQALNVVEKLLTAGHWGDVFSFDVEKLMVWLLLNVPLKPEVIDGFRAHLLDIAFRRLPWSPYDLRPSSAKLFIHTFLHLYPGYAPTIATRISRESVDSFRDLKELWMQAFTLLDDTEKYTVVTTMAKTSCSHDWRILNPFLPFELPEDAQLELVTHQMDVLGDHRRTYRRLWSSKTRSRDATRSLEKFVGLPPLLTKASLSFFWSRMRMEYERDGPGGKLMLYPREMFRLCSVLEAANLQSLIPAWASTNLKHLYPFLAPKYCPEVSLPVQKILMERAKVLYQNSPRIPVKPLQYVLARLTGVAKHGLSLCIIQGAPTKNQPHHELVQLAAYLPEEFHPLMLPHLKASVAFYREISPSPKALWYIWVLQQLHHQYGVPYDVVATLTSFFHNWKVQVDYLDQVLGNLEAQESQFCQLKKFLLPFFGHPAVPDFVKPRAINSITHKRLFTTIGGDDLVTRWISTQSILNLLRAYFGFRQIGYVTDDCTLEAQLLSIIASRAIYPPAAVRLSLIKDWRGEEMVKVVEIYLNRTEKPHVIPLLEPRKWDYFKSRIPSGNYFKIE